MNDKLIQAPADRDADAVRSPEAKQIHSKKAWGIASLYSWALASETRDLAAHIDLAIDEALEAAATAVRDKVRRERQQVEAYRQASYPGIPDNWPLPPSPSEEADASVRDKVMEWKTIETAPKDGTPVLLCDARTGSMRWAVWAQLPAHANDPNADWLGWRDGTIEARGSIVGVIPTHWMSLPSPPCVPGRD